MGVICTNFANYGAPPCRRRPPKKCGKTVETLGNALLDVEFVCWQNAGNCPKMSPKNLREKRLLYINAPKSWENHGRIFFEDLWKSPNDSWWRLIAGIASDLQIEHSNVFWTVRIDSNNLNIFECIMPSASILFNGNGHESDS